MKDSISITWHIDDVKNRAETLDILITDSEAREILERVESNYDCNNGITWETFLLL